MSKPKLEITGKYKRIARQFYLHSPSNFVSVNDFRKARLHELLDHPNTIGALFNALVREKILIKSGRRVKALHKEARGRKVTEYVWTHKARSVLDIEPHHVRG